MTDKDLREELRQAGVFAKMLESEGWELYMALSRQVIEEIEKERKHVYEPRRFAMLTDQIKTIERVMALPYNEAGKLDILARRVEETMKMRRITNGRR